MYPTLLFLVLSISHPTLAYEDKPNEYTKFDYCTLNCGENVHSACKCARTPPREEMRHVPYMEFRTTVLNEHNKFRDYVASGKETRPKEGWTPPAANMMIMSYDLEMEYITRCRGVMTFRHNADDPTGHDKCRVRMGNLDVGQNLHGSSSNGTETFINKGIKNWYEEVALIEAEDYVEHFPGAGHGIGHYTQLIWWSADRMGCSMVYNPENKKSWRYTLICNYASTIDPQIAGNLKLGRIYKRTDNPCDSCPNATKCGDTPGYPSLCGKQAPIPTQAPALIKMVGETDAGTYKKGSKFVMCFPVVVLYLVY
ncbi:hypothetical protein Zmor_013012 [Zophobas morio]|uniref:SCP domain-containing protein n=1 Tax=Zophobas morio TaxID=2755281 RepID=A0AA38MBA6_9CUCU|nr:hypothetical protein Zmor_021745 [Zophobas morio]KAJ3653777.1 hypothetical protein Zmor_013012 [Zophobas morio]